MNYRYCRCLGLRTELSYYEFNMLTLILIVTISAPNLSMIEEAYRDYLGYKVVERGTVPKALAGVWGAPAAAGRAYLLMKPESGEEVYLRFVQSDPTEGYAPLRTFGWNATEILVKDPDDLAKRLANSPFRIIGPPKNLSSNGNIRAMQVIGPASEVLYLTRPGKSKYSLGSASTFVDYVFIVVVAGDDMESMRDFYTRKMKLPVTNAHEVPISILSNAHGLPPEHRYRLAVAQLPVRFLIEIDEYPRSAAAARPKRKGDLFPGMSFVSFAVKSIDSLDLELIQPPVVIKEAPYNGRRVALTIGAAGELIELIETP